MNNIAVAKISVISESNKPIFMKPKKIKKKQ